MALGEALRKALGDKRGISRYGAAAESDSTRYGAAAEASAAEVAVTITLPMDETIARAALDLSGRPCFVFDGAPDVSRAIASANCRPNWCRISSARCAIRLVRICISRVRGENAHHMVEACFKAVARALRTALRREGSELPSTKGLL